MTMQVGLTLAAFALGLVVQLVVVVRFASRLERQIDVNQVKMDAAFSAIDKRVEQVETRLNEGSIVILDPRKSIRIELESPR